jgi:4-diphosphocytidyl-2-C-methyl-D-erythritol kinase
MRLPSPAKINIRLLIKKLRSDDYHEIDSLFAKIDLADYLTFTPKNSGIEIKTQGDYKVPSNADNIVYKAAYALQQKCKIRSGIKILIDKKIPLESGLGGGSSNAATTLMYLNSFWKAGLSITELQEIAANLGADIPFFLSNSSIAHIGGKGEKILHTNNDIAISKQLQTLNLENILTDNSYTIILVFPHNIKISTAWAFAQMKNRYQGKYPQELNTHNSFEKVIFNIYPDLEIIKNILLDSEAIHASLSGSGSTIFGIFKNMDFHKIEKQLEKRGKCIAAKIIF